MYKLKQDNLFKLRINIATSVNEKKRKRKTSVYIYMYKYIYKSNIALNPVMFKVRIPHETTTGCEDVDLTHRMFS